MCIFIPLTTFITGYWCNTCSISHNTLYYTERILSCLKWYLYYGSFSKFLWQKICVCHMKTKYFREYCNLPIVYLVLVCTIVAILCGSPA